MPWYQRYIESAVKVALKDTPVVCLVGSRQVGKTTLAQRLEPKRAYISFDDASLLEAARRDPLGYVRALPVPVILDEIQRVPELLPAIKMMVDEQRLNNKKKAAGRFLLTGSANLLLLPKVNESLAGRMEVIQLNPISELEMQGKKNSILQTLLAGNLKTSIAARQDFVQGLAKAICRGGYPEPNALTPARARQWYKQYLQAIMQRDVQDVATIRDQDELSRLMTILANRTATLLNISSLANELRLDRATVEKYVSVLERLFLVRRLRAWHQRDAKRLIKTPKIHVVDSGLATTLNGLDAKDWSTHSDVFGHLLESFVVQQLICQAGWVDPDLQFYHYRDKDQVEVDLVIEQGRKVWGVEVKRSTSVQSSDGAGLARLASQAGKNFCGGILFYTGANCLPLDMGKDTADCFAVPINRLWGD